MKKLCIYHGNCADGFGAACVVRMALGFERVDFHAGIYQSDPPDVAGLDVVLVDFSYKRPALIEMAAKAKSILILDHHKSAAADLVNLPDNVEAHFDMERSGVMMAWDHYYPGQQAPPLLAHIQDRDLWRFELDGTRQIQAALFSYPYDFDRWEDLIHNADLEALRKDGYAIERKHLKDIHEFIESAAYRLTIAGYDVPVLNTSYFFSSDAGHIMSKGEHFAACYWDTPDGRVFSLRSEDGGMDVSEVAAKFGGGGHEHAAGFKVELINYDVEPE